MQPLFPVPRTLDLCPRGSQAEATGRATTGNAADGPLLAALALGTVWPAVTALPRGEWLISQPGQVTDLALHAPGSSLGHSGLFLFPPTAPCDLGPQQPHMALDCKPVLCVCPITETGQQVSGDLSKVGTVIPVVHTWKWNGGEVLPQVTQLGSMGAGPGCRWRARRGN